MQGIGPYFFYSNWLLTSSWKESFVAGGYGSFIYSTITINLRFRCYYHSSSPCFAQFCDFDIVLLKFCFIEGPYTIIFFKIHIDSWTRGIRPCLIHFEKKKEKEIKISKNHASISKLRAFGHASSILKKKKKKSYFPQISRFSKIMNQFAN